jgi:hypothetical protein
MPQGRSYAWNTTIHPNGTYSIEIIVDDGIDSARDQSGQFRIRNEEKADNTTDDDGPDDDPVIPDEGGSEWGIFIFIILVILIVIIMVMFFVAARSVYKRTRKDEFPAVLEE